MGKQSKKSKSKRISLSQKHKVLKKVKLHHKKKAKEAKNLGLNNSNKKKTKVQKGDPDIPNDWPLKEQELQALEARRAKAIQELEQKKAAHIERPQKRKLGMLDDDGDDMSNLVNEKQAFGKRGKDSTITTHTRDNSDRAFYKELAKVIDASDVILEVLDARDPIGTRCVDMERMVIRAGHEKHLVLLLNKIDLVPREAVEKWLKYLREELPAVAFKCSTQEQRSNLGWKSGSKGSKAAKPSTILQTSDCLGAETLLKLLKNYSRSHEIKKSITVGVVGLPNVGKSSLINSLKRCHVVNVGATPGLTRSMQEVQLDKNVKLLDCPGVVMLRSGESDASVALRNCKRIEKLDDPVGPVMEILKLCPADMLVALYKMPTFDSVDDFLQKVAIVRGKLKKGGIVDVDAAARIVLHDWNEGKIPYYTMPPTRNTDVPSEAKIITELGKEFNADEVYGTESSFIGSLKSVDEFDPVEVPTSGPVRFDEPMLENDLQQPAQSNPGKEVMESLNGDDDQTMVEDENDEIVEKKTTKTANSRQNEKLYDVEGVLNPKARKAEKKRRKKANNAAATAATAAAMEDDDAMGGDYDFKEDYSKKGTAMDVGEEDDSTNEVVKNRFELPVSSEGDLELS